MKKRQGILIVDDDDAYRERMVRELSVDYETVVGAETGEEATRILAEDPSRFQFAVVDHQLDMKKGELDGIQTTEQLVKIAPRIYPVVFSNVRVVTSPEIAKHTYKAMEAGAYRYLEWKTEQKDRKKDISDFVSEIEHLANLSEWISRFFEARASAPSLLTQLNVGIDIIDRHFKVWFMSERMREIVGLPGPTLPREPCSHWHGYTHCPCVGCLVKKSLVTGESQDGKIFLSPLPFRDKDRVFFLKVWAQPVKNETGIIVESSKPDGGPLAVMESVQDLTDSPELKAMPLSERLRIIAQAPLGITTGKYTVAPIFHYCRVYQLDLSAADGAFVLKAAAGTPAPPSLGVPVNIRSRDRVNLEKAEQNTRETGYGYGFTEPTGHDLTLPGINRSPYIYCPVIENNTTVALIEVGCANNQTETASLLKPYAREVLHAILDNRARLPEHVLLISKQVSEVEQSLQTKTSPEEQLMTIIKEACELTNSHQYVLRYVDGASAKIVRLKIPEFCAYENVATDEYSRSYKESWSCRAIDAKAELLVDIVHNETIINKNREALREDARDVLEDANGLCYEPLILDGVCIGVLGFHSRGAINYGDKRKIGVIRALAKRATMALHDYIVEQKSIEKAQTDALSDILGLVLHNIKSPLAAAGIILTLMEKRRDLAPDVRELIDDCKCQLSKISRVRDDVLNLKRPAESRIETVSLTDFLEKIAADIVAAAKDVSVELKCAEGPKKVDKPILKLCLEVLLQNAVDSVKDNKGDKRVCITVRSATDNENLMIESSLRGLAFDVQDNGPGVSSEITEYLFKKIRSSKSTGLGMGLWHCRAFSHSAQGAVYYDHDFNQGARFTLVLPYQEDKEAL